MGCCGKNRVQNVVQQTVRSPEVYPNLFEMGLNLGGTLERAGKALLSGKRIQVSKSIHDKRLEACMGTKGLPKCEYYDRAQGRCRECGCFIHAKAWVATDDCRIGRW